MKNTKESSKGKRRAKTHATVPSERRQIPDQAINISRQQVDDWMKPSHRGGNTPGYYIDTDGEYDIGICGDDVTIYPWSKRLSKREWSRIIQHPDDPDTWICGCRNVTDFQPCLKSGRAVDPTVEDWTDGPFYWCPECGNVFDGKTLSIVARHPNVNETICVFCKQDVESADVGRRCPFGGREHLTFG